MYNLASISFLRHPDVNHFVDGLIRILLHDLFFNNNSDNFINDTNYFVYTLIHIQRIFSIKKQYRQSVVQLIETVF